MGIDASPAGVHGERRLAIAGYVTSPRSQVPHQQFLKLWTQAIERHRARNPKPEVLSEWPRNLSDEKIAPADRPQARCPAECCLRS
jgi:hypothetical protein